MGITTLVRTEPQGGVSLFAPAPSELGPEWPQLWFALVQRAWSSLAIVPVGPDVPALFAASALASAGRLYRHWMVHLLDAEGAGPPAAGSVVDAAADIAARGEQSIIAVDSPLANHAAIHIARSADAALLLVPLGRAGLVAARRTIECIGRERFIGSVAVGPVPGSACR